MNQLMLSEGNRLSIESKTFGGKKLYPGGRIGKHRAQPAPRFADWNQREAYVPRHLSKDEK